MKISMWITAALMTPAMGVIMLAARFSIRFRNYGSNKILIRLLKIDRIHRIYDSPRVLNTFLYKIATPSGVRLSVLMVRYKSEVELLEKVFNITQAHVRYLKRTGTI